MLRRDGVERGQHQRVGEEDRVVEKRLRGHQRERDQRALAMQMQQRVPHVAERRVAAASQPHLRQRRVGNDVPLGAQPRLDAGNDPFRLIRAAMRHQPARAFRQPHPHEEHDQRQHRADQERGAPAVLRIDHRRIEQHDGAERAERRAHPERAVDDQIGPAAHARRHQFLDGRIDRRVFAADARAGDEAEEEEAPQIPRERRRGGRQQVDGKRDEEQLLAPKPVGQPAEEDRAQHRAGEICAARETDIGIAELQHRACLECARDGAGERDFKPVEDPRDPECHHHQRMKAAPRQPVEPRRNVGFDDRRLI